MTTHTLYNLVSIPLPIVTHLHLWLCTGGWTYLIRYHISPYSSVLVSQKFVSVFKSSYFERQIFLFPTTVNGNRYYARLGSQPVVSQIYFVGNGLVCCLTKQFLFDSLVSSNSLYDNMHQKKHGFHSITQTNRRKTWINFWQFLSCLGILTC